MTDKEIAAYVELAEEHRRRIKNNPAEAKAFLVRAGIMKEDGTISENYPAWRALDLKNSA